MKERLPYLAQLAGTLLILAFVPTNLAKLVCLLLLWALTFRRLNRSEMMVYAIACAVFTVMDVLATTAGSFFFTQPDVLGLPMYEPFMWGFYLLHTWRILGGPAPPRPPRPSWILPILFALAFVVLSDHRQLLLFTTAVCAVTLARFHDIFDLSYFGYMVVLGVLVELTGVHSGQWGYHGDFLLGMPLWFITMWGGVGLFFRRFALPILMPLDPGVK